MESVPPVATDSRGLPFARNSTYLRCDDGFCCYFFVVAPRAGYYCTEARAYAHCCTPCVGHGISRISPAPRYRTCDDPFGYARSVHLFRGGGRYVRISRTGIENDMQGTHVRLSWPTRPPSKARERQAHKSGGPVVARNLNPRVRVGGTVVVVVAVGAAHSAFPTHRKTPPT